MVRLINPPFPVKGSDVTVATDLTGPERCIGVRVTTSPTSSGKSITIPVSLIAQYVSTQILPPTSVVVPGTYGTSLTTPQILVDERGWILAIQDVTIAPRFSNVSVSGGNYTAVSGQDTIKIHGAQNIGTSITSNVLTVFDLDTSASAGSYGTALMIPTLDVNAVGKITSIGRVTVAPFIQTINASLGSFVAVSSPDTLNVIGDSTHITTSITGSNLTISQVDSGASAGTYGTSVINTQIEIDAKGRIVSATRVTIGPMFANVGSSSGSYAAVSSADTINILGNSTHISTDIVGNTLTISPVNSGASAGTYGTSVINSQIQVDAAGRIVAIQPVTIGPMFAKVSSSSGSYTAVSSADVIKVHGGGKITAAIASNVLTVSDVSSGVSTGTYGTSAVVPQITIDGFGKITLAARVTITPLDIGAAYVSLQGQQFAGSQATAVTSIISTSSSLGVDLRLNNDFAHTMTENTTLQNPIAVVIGAKGRIIFTQHASSAKTLAFGSSYKFEGGTVPAISTSVGSTDSLYYDAVTSTQILCNLKKGFS